MTEQEIAEILEVGPTHPRYEEYKMWQAANTAATSGLNSPKDKPQPEKSSKIAMSPEELQNMTSQRADVQNAIERSIGANPATNKLDQLTGNITGIHGNPLKKEDINPDGSLTSKGELAAAENRANNPANDVTEGEFQVGDKVTSAESEADKESEPEKGDTPKETKAKNKYRNQSMSIWDAYYNGEFGDPDSDEAKRTRNYFIIDAIANFAKNTGRSIGNVGAQYSGGTIDEGQDTSQWENIRNTLGSEELQISREQLGGPAERRATSELLNNKLTALSANRSATVNDLINEIKAEADKAESEAAKKAYLALAAQLAGAGMNNVSLGASAVTGLVEDIQNWIKGN